MIFLKWYSIIYMIYNLIVYVYGELQENEFGKVFLGIVMLSPIIIYLILN